MKTNNFSSRKLSIYSVFGLLALVVTSCGTTYQNKSYYDNDGVYVSEAPKKAVDDDRKDNEKYKDYFSTLNQENQEVFTDVENYTSSDSIISSENQNRGYSSWGSNSTESVVVNIYDNNWGLNNWGWGGGWNNWGWGGGWNNWGWGGGWNNWGWNSWYGPNWGWGWNGFYGNGWYGNGWNNGYYGNNYAFVNGPRGGRTATVNRDSRFNTNRNSANPRSFTTSNTRNNTSGTRATSTGSGTRVNTGAPRTNTNSGTRVNTSTRPQNNDGGTRVNTTRSNTTTRSYSDTPRSYSPSPSSSGGGRSGGYSGGGSSGGGGGRSGGGGRR